MICILHLIVNDPTMLLAYPSAGEREFDRKSVLSQSKSRISDQDAFFYALCSSLRAISESNVGGLVLKAIPILVMAFPLSSFLQPSPGSEENLVSVFVNIYLCYVCVIRNPRNVTY